MRALHAEWTKLRTVSGPAWLLITAVAATVAVSTAAVSSARCPVAGCGLDPARTSLAGVYLGQALMAVLGVLTIGNEYSTGMIRVTLAAMPRRFAFLAAKAAVLAGPALVTAAIAVAGSALAGRLILPGRGFTAAHGYPSLAGGADLRAAAGTAVYLALIALLALGVGVIVRDSAAAVGVILGLLYLFPIVAGVVSDPVLARHLQQIGPMTAGLAVEATTGLREMPLTPWQGLGVLAAWTAGALAVAAVTLRLRDA